jgi:hypothetical protein
MFEEIIEEVRAIDLEIIEECAKNSRVKELYLGTHIFFGPFYEREKDGIIILFIGINPSCVHGDWPEGNDLRWIDENGKRHNYNEMSDGLQYIVDGNEKTKLGKSVKEVFPNGTQYLLYDSSSKINCYPFATKGENELKTLLKSLPENLQNKINELSKKWLVEVIDKLKPWLIFCEGKCVWKFLKGIYSNELCSDEKKMCEREKELENNHVMKTTLSDMDVIVAERRHSQFRNPELCKLKIAEFIKETGV